MKKATKVKPDESETALPVATPALNPRLLDDRRVRRRGGGGVLDSGGGGVLSNGGTFDGGGGGSGSCVEHEVQSIAANF
jgi:hypothetical protein